jgi:hypothetical protein
MQHRRWPTIRRRNPNYGFGPLRHVGPNDVVSGNRIIGRDPDPFIRASFSAITIRVGPIDRRDSVGDAILTLAAGAATDSTPPIIPTRPISPDRPALPRLCHASGVHFCVVALVGVARIE